LHKLIGKEDIKPDTVKLLKGFYTSNKFELEPESYPATTPVINIERG
jgi:hypothetical protein